jgi:hypothetical protein
MSASRRFFAASMIAAFSSLTVGTLRMREEEADNPPLVRGPLLCGWFCGMCGSGVGIGRPSFEDAGDGCERVGGVDADKTNHRHKESEGDAEQDGPDVGRRNLVAQGLPDAGEAGIVGLGLGALLLDPLQPRHVGNDRVKPSAVGLLPLVYPLDQLAVLDDEVEGLGSEGAVAWGHSRPCTTSGRRFATFDGFRRR